MVSFKMALSYLHRFYVELKLGTWSSRLTWIIVNSLCQMFNSCIPGPCHTQATQLLCCWNVGTSLEIFLCCFTRNYH